MPLPSPLYKERYVALPCNPNNHTINPMQNATRQLDVKAIIRQEVSLHLFLSEIIITMSSCHSKELLCRGKIKKSEIFSRDEKQQSRKTTITPVLKIQ